MPPRGCFPVRAPVRAAFGLALALGTAAPVHAQAPDKRVPMEPTAWPFTAIGRVNVVRGRRIAAIAPAPWSGRVTC